jgi:hypothetical protein
LENTDLPFLFPNARPLSRPFPVDGKGCLVATRRIEVLAQNRDYRNFLPPYFHNHLIKFFAADAILTIYDSLPIVNLTK